MAPFPLNQHKSGTWSAFSAHLLSELINLFDAGLRIPSPYPTSPFTPSPSLPLSMGTVWGRAERGLQKSSPGCGECVHQLAQTSWRPGLGLAQGALVASHCRQAPLRYGMDRPYLCTEPAYPGLLVALLSPKKEMRVCLGSSEHHWFTPQHPGGEPMGETE